VSPRAPLDGSSSKFPETRWTRVLAAKGNPEKRRALTEELIGSRWLPL
jgi:hypothetical protein